MHVPFTRSKCGLCTLLEELAEVTPSVDALSEDRVRHLRLNHVSTAIKASAAA